MAQKLVKSMEVVGWAGIGLVTMAEVVGIWSQWWWLGLFLPILIVGVYGWGRALIWLVRFRAWLAMGILGLMAVLSVYQIGSWKSYSFETANELGCALSAAENGDLRQATCLYGYPARQFLVSVVPSMLLGRSMASMNLGPWLYFIVGLGVYAWGFVGWFGKKAWLVLGVALALFLNLYHLHMWLAFYEQSLYPFAFSMMVVGFWLRYKQNGRSVWLMLMVLVLAYSAHAYTSLLALVALTLAWLGWEFGQKLSHRQEVRLIGVSVCLIVLQVLLSFQYREDFGQGSRQMLGDYESVLVSGFEEVVINNFRYAPISDLGLAVVAVTIGFGVVGLLGSEAVVVGVWYLLVVSAAILFHGFGGDLLQFRLHKVLVAYPLVGWLIGILVSRFSNKFLHFWWLVLAVSMVVTGVEVHKFMRNRLMIENEIRVVKVLKEDLKIGWNQAVNLSYSPIFTNELTELDDAISYFYPNGKIEVTEIDCERLGDNDQPEVFLVSGSLADNCSGRLRLYGTYELYYQKPVTVVIDDK